MRLANHSYTHSEGEISEGLEEGRNNVQGIGLNGTQLTHSLGLHWINGHVCWLPNTFSGDCGMSYINYVCGHKVILQMTSCLILLAELRWCVTQLGGQLCAYS